MSSAENEPEVSRLEEQLWQQHVSYEGAPMLRVDEPGLARSLRHEDLAVHAARRWSVEKLRPELEEA